MAKKTTSKVSLENFYRSPCPAIDQILLVRKLNAEQALTMYEDLKLFVSNLPVEGAILNYIKYLIAKLLHDPDVLSPYLDEETYETVMQQVYECIVDIYISFRIEVICTDINNLQPLNPWAPVDVKNFDYLKPLNEELEKLLKDPDAMEVPPPHLEGVSSSSRRKKGKFDLTAKDLSSMETSLKKNILGQDEAIEALINRMKLIAVGFEKRGTFFFVGRTGVGKTELAKLFGKKYCNNFAKINCGEYTNGHEVAKLIGAPPGYIGSNNKSFFLEKAEASNRWVFLFDEIEKANDRLFNLLLSLLDDGTITDSGGNTLDFTNSIFIFTSNQGVSEIKEKMVGFGGEGTSMPASRETLRNSLDKLFTPEFRNRIDEFIFFNDLTPSDVQRIVKMNLRQYPVHITDEVVDFAVEKAYSVQYGVRELKRFLKANVGLPIASHILDHMAPIDGSGKYTMVKQDGKLVVDKVAKIPSKILGK